MHPAVTRIKALQWRALVCARTRIDRRLPVPVSAYASSSATDMGISSMLVP